MKTTSILVVDNDKTFSQVLRSILDQDGYKVEVASDLDSAISILNRDIDFDLILTDLFLPKKEGITLLKIIKSNPLTEKINTCIITSFNDEIYMDEAFKYGATDYILKSLNKICLLERINQNIIAPHKTSECYIALLEVTDIINDFKIEKFDETRIIITAKDELPVNARIRIKSKGLRPFVGNSDQIDCVVNQCILKDESVKIICNHQLK